MLQQFTLEYWQDAGWYVGRVLEIPGVFSQGETLEDLNKNIKNAYWLMTTMYRPPYPEEALRQPIELDVSSNGT